MERYKNLIVLLLVLIIIIAGGAAWYKKFGDGNTHERVKVSSIDVEKAEGAEKVPEHFPKDIPLQLTDVEDSFDMEYTERNIIVSGITYKTYRSANELFQTYKLFMESNGYFINEKSTKEENGVLYASKNGSTLGVIIAFTDEVNTARRVQVVYTQKSVQ